MTERVIGDVTYAQTFDVENRLTSVTGNGKTATFAYDADGNRILTLDKTGTTETSRVYSPFPEFERTVAGGVTTERSSYSIAGQLVAVRVKSGSNSTLTYLYTDHLGSVVAMTGAAGGANPVTTPAATPAPPQTSPQSPAPAAAARPPRPTSCCPTLCRWCRSSCCTGCGSG